MSTTKNILVIGATGLIGQYILAAIVKAKSHFGTIAILTSPDTASKKAQQIEAIKAEGIDIRVGDVTKEEDVRKAYAGIDTVVSAVGRNVILNQIDLLKWADSTPHIKRFYPSEYGTDIDYDASSVDEKPHQLKLKVRAFIKSDVKNLEYTYLVTGPYSDLFIGKPPTGHELIGGFDVKNRKAVLLGDGKGPVSFTSEGDVGTLLVASLLHPAESRNRALKVNSFTATPEEILAEFEKQTGGEKWNVSYTSLEDLKKGEEKAWADGSPAATGYTLRRIWTSGKTLYEKRDNDVIGDPSLETLQDQVKLIIRKQLSS